MARRIRWKTLTLWDIPVIPVLLIRAVSPWVGRKLIKYRAALSPLLLALGLALVATVLHTWVSPWWPVPAFTGVLAAALIWFLGEHLSPHWRNAVLFLVPDAIDDGRKGVLDRPTERGYVAVLLVFAGLWTAQVTEHGWTRVWWWTLLGGVLALGSPWWFHRRIRRRVNRYVRRWPVVRERIKGFEGSTVRLVSKTRTVTVLSVKLAPAKTIQHVGQAGLELDSAFGLRGGAVTVSKNRGAARLVEIRIVPRSPWKGRIAHPMPAIGSLDITAPDPHIPVGVLDDAQIQEVGSMHIIAGVGQRGSGKSTLAESIILSETAYDPLLWLRVGIDMAGKATLGVWEDIYALPLADSVTAAMGLLAGLFAEGQHRERVLDACKRADPGYGNVLKVTREYPAIFCDIDELPSLIKEGGPGVVMALEQGAQRLRKVNIHFRMFAQNPTEHDIGSTELRAQIGYMIGLLLDSRQNKTLWADGTKEGWNSTQLGVGQHLCRGREHTLPRVAQGFYVTPAQRAKRIAELSRRHARATLDPATRARLTGGGVAIDDGKSGTVLVEPRPVLTKADRPMRAVPSSASLATLADQVHDALPARGSGGITPSDLARRLDISRDRVNRALATLKVAGRARSYGGAWSKEGER